MSEFNETVLDIGNADQVELVLHSYASSDDVRFLTSSAPDGTGPWHEVGRVAASPPGTTTSLSLRSCCRYLRFDPANPSARVSVHVRVLLRGAI